MKLISAVLLMSTVINYVNAQEIERSPKMHFKSSTSKVIEAKIRKCCSFGDNWLLQATGLSRITSPKNLGKHSFIFSKNHSWKKERNGLIFTCKAGFLDITHVRDHADITLQIYNRLIDNSEKLTLKKSPTRRQFIMKDYSGLSREDIIQIAASMAYDIAVWHELETLPKFNGVSMQSNSAFSVEDNISNFLGTELAAQAILENNDFDADVTLYLQEFLANSKPAETKKQTKDIISALKKKWWKFGLGFKSVLKRHINPYGELIPLIPEDTGKLACTEDDKTSLGLNSIRVLSNGQKASDYYDFEIFLNKKMKKFLRKNRIGFEKNRITTKQFEVIIHSMIPRYEKRLGKNFSIQ